MAMKFSDELNSTHPIYQFNEDRHMGRIMDYNTTVFDAETQLIRGTMSFSPERLRELDPSYTGFTHVFVLRMPPMLIEVGKSRYVGASSGNSGDDISARAATYARNLKTILEMGCTSYSGTPSLEIGNTQVQVGWSDRVYTVPTTSSYEGTQFTLTCLEFRGEPLRRGLEYVGQGMSDPATKAALMNGALDVSSNNLMLPTMDNISWSFMIVQTDQTNIDIQDISLWQACTFTTIDRSSLDWENGQVDIVAPRQVTFNGNYIPATENQLLRALARKLLFRRLRYSRRFKDLREGWLGAQDWNVVVGDGDPMGSSSTSSPTAQRYQDSGSEYANDWQINGQTYEQYMGVPGAGAGATT